ncbi:MAG: hypothetical protein ACKOXF_08720 [Chitinophagaceae bacterium]
MKFKFLLLFAAGLLLPLAGNALSSGDVNIRQISGYYWMDNACTAGSPLGKVVSFRVKNTKGSLIQNISVELTGLTFVATGGTSYSSGTPSFQCKTPTKVYLGDIPAGDSVTAFFYVGYNCLMYPNNTNLTTDYLTSSVKLADNASGTVSTSFNRNIYVLRNSNNNTITILATSTNTVGTSTTISVAYSISNVKPSNIIDMELSTTQAFPAGYSITGCRITASTIPSDFPVNLTNTHYSNAITSNLPSGGTVTIEWYLKITGASTGITSSNLVPYIVSDAGSSQRWQANTTAFTGTSTPSNPITMTKRANKTNVLTGDTVVYTIVVKNSSTTTDVTIDRLVDKLPRDYKFRYIEKNTSVFPRLITYTNSTAYPVFQDTGYLVFSGHKEISSGVFSYVIPRQDSVKLIYSVTASSTVGSNDTNIIISYVGTSAVATAFAKVNVVAVLPVKLLHFSALGEADGVNVRWTASSLEPGDKFELSKFENGALTSTLLSDYQINDYSNIQHFNFQDLSSDISSSCQYKLMHYSNSGQISEFVTELSGDLKQSIQTRLDGENLAIILNGDFGKEAEIVITDMLGKELYREMSDVRSGFVSIPFNAASLPQQLLFVTVHSSKNTYTERLLSRL